MLNVVILNVIMPSVVAPQKPFNQSVIFLKVRLLLVWSEVQHF
jgi:hypothetical protein